MPEPLHPALLRLAEIIGEHIAREALAEMAAEEAAARDGTDVEDETRGSD